MPRPQRTSRLLVKMDMAVLKERSRVFRAAFDLQSHV
jgi:hypothetical protein